jgi:hypothetical protein
VASRKVSRTVQFDPDTDGRVNRVATLRRVSYAVIVREIVEQGIEAYEREEVARYLRRQQTAELVEAAV